MSYHCFFVLVAFLPIIYFKEIQFGTTPSGAAAAWQHPPRFADAAAQCGPQLEYYVVLRQ